jgi:DNA-binding CsgD family transcriptional regulator
MVKSVIGRDAELRSVQGFLAASSSSPRALVIAGEPGIGKTTLWQAGVNEAHSNSVRVLVARPAEGESKLSYVALGDLLEGLRDRDLSDLPGVQRMALEAALLRAEAKDPIQQRAVSAAFFGVVTSFARERPVIVAVDDLQWLDHSSAQVLAYAARRLRDQPVGFLLAARRDEGRVATPHSNLLDGLPENRLRLELGPLTLGALHHVIRDRLGRTLPRPLLARVAACSGGNPFFALEIARALLDSAAARPPVGEGLPVPDSVKQLLLRRLRRLSTGARDVLLVASAMAHPTVGALEGAVGKDVTPALDEAEEAGMVEQNGAAVRFSHPLYASVVYSSARATERRRIHGRVAAVATNAEERARHLALSAVQPDEKLAAVLEEAAGLSLARGAPDSATELGELSVRLTPPGCASGLARRCLKAADYCFEAGDTARARELLEQTVVLISPGATRAEALLRLACVRHYERDREGAAAVLEEALGEVGDNSEQRAWIHSVFARVLAWSSDVDGALVQARAAGRLAEGSDDPALQFLALTAVAMCEVFAGNGLPRDVLERAFELDDPEISLAPVLLQWHPWINFSSLLVYVEEFGPARERLEGMLERAREGGDDGALPELLFWLGELEWRAGNFRLAKRHATEGYDAALQTGQQLMVAQLSSTKALARAALGEIRGARDAADEGLTLARELGSAPPTIRNLAALGFLELSLDDVEKAAIVLSEADDYARSTGYREPGQFLFAGNLIEALGATGSHAEAGHLATELEAQGRGLGRVWAVVAGARGRALAAAAEGKTDEASEAIGIALARQEDLSMPFETARTLLAAGLIERRRRQKRAARELLERAAAVFDELGARLWADKARAELARVSGRRPEGQELTATERRVATLVAEGLANKEVAAALFVTVHTVEAHLSRIYRKLGIHSRRDLARVPAAPSGEATAEA